MAAKKKSTPELFESLMQEPRHKYINPRLSKLSKLGLEIYDFLRSEGPSKSVEVGEWLFGERPGAKRLAKVTKELTKMRKAGLVFAGKDGYATVDNIISFLLENGPSYYTEIAKELGSYKDYIPDYGIGAFLKVIDSHNVVATFKRGMEKEVFYLPYVPSHEKESKIKAIKHAKELYEALADGALKTATDLSAVLEMAPKSVARFIDKIEEDLEWLSKKTVRGETFKHVYFRNDKVAQSTLKDLEEIEAETVEEKIKLAVKEPRTATEVVEKTKLNEKTIYSVLNNLEKERLVSGVKASPSRYSSMTPKVWVLKTGNPEADKLNEVKASFKSASQTYGLIIFEHLYKNVVSPRQKIADAIGIDVERADSPLKILKKYGLVDNERGLYWYNSRLVDNNTLEKINKLHAELDEETFENVLRLYSTVKNGIYGFKIDYRNNMFVAEPNNQLLKNKKISMRELQGLAASKHIIVQVGNSYLVPAVDKTKELGGWSWYRELSRLTKGLFE